jgi:hypothetical protein
MMNKIKKVKKSKVLKPESDPCKWAEISLNALIKDESFIKKIEKLYMIDETIKQ